MTLKYEYYVIERDGKFYGVEYADGYCTCYNFIAPDQWGSVKKLSKEVVDGIREHGWGWITYSGNAEIFSKEMEGAVIRKVKETIEVNLQ